MVSRPLGTIVDLANRLWPPALAEEWDNPGLALGSLDAEISRILLAVDVTPSVLEEARASECQLILTHHPSLFRQAGTLRQDSWPGGLLSRAAEERIALFSAHTNADAAEDGVNDALALALGLSQTHPLHPVKPQDRTGIGRRGILSRPAPLVQVAHDLARALPGTAAGILVQGCPDRPIRSVTLCSGSGADFLSDPAVRLSDLYVTSDLKHHEALDVRSAGELGLRAPALICVSHWAGESLWLTRAAAAISRETGIECILSAQRTDPWDFRVGDGDGE
ncbi:MAG: Nif3-like dinuclear metal center hexameric protein [Microbacteriaceae bacterium]|jgi:dinuclear metal center YbgI/SA1388 family protein|nr:Nif3-like dinuclear metal center hexameric protein [Microbacteriaceae bacterium]MCI1207656.1 Nif3-like dinuclear metal center hexameric protein [Microbacteriaceae bacterium]